jgi:two-component system sensor histidine kinase CpxA
MKSGKLYVKILLWFLLVLVVTELLVFGLFMHSAGRQFRSRFEQYLEGTILLVKELVEEKIRAIPPGSSPAANKSLASTLSQISKTFHAKMWLEASDGTIFLRSFAGDIPIRENRIYKTKKRRSSGFLSRRDFRRDGGFYMAVPIEIQRGDMGRLHIILENMPKQHPESGFALGLLGIGFVIALLIIPISRRITGPLKSLGGSVLRIADGDLSHRADIRSKDEIGDLGDAFNHMADGLERMIRGGKELIANISHELRSPLARIRIAAELLQEELKSGDDKDTDTHLNDIKSDIKELDRLIERILVLSKLDISETPLKSEPVNLSELINGLFKRFRSTIGRKKLRVITDMPTNAVYYGDSDALYTALSNVLDNAIKFSPEKGEMIMEIRSTLEWLEIHTTNSFRMFSDEELSGLFVPFYRVERAPVSGSGLGLAITKKIIEKHGGRIEARNSKRGFEILIFLPMGTQASKKPKSKK